MKDNNNTLIIVVIALLAFLLLGGFGFGMMGYPWLGGMMGMMYGYGGTGSWVLGWIFSILIIVIMVLAVVWLVKQIQKK